MELMLPAEPARARSLTGTLPLLSRSIDGSAGPTDLPAARAAIVILIDGLGASALAEVPGHARFLAAHTGKRDIAITTFPTTTATALTSLLTATDAGAHGVIGYSTHVPGSPSGSVVNQLNGWSGDQGGSLDPETWQRCAPWSAAHDLTVVTKPEYAASGFTRATSAGAEIVTGDSIRERLDRAAERAESGAVIYVYVPELDQAGHRNGWRSDRWLAVLEQIDAELRAFAGRLPADVGVVVTADHGMVDVPHERQVLFGDGSLTDGVSTVAGEPRLLQLYTERGAAERVRDAWQRSEGARAWVMTRDDAIATGLFGLTDPDVAPRIGDVLVAARAEVAYYDERVADTSPRGMIGQHGSLTSAERIVPFLRVGAFARR